MLRICYSVIQYHLFKKLDFVLGWKLIMSNTKKLYERFCELALERLVHILGATFEEKIENFALSYRGINGHTDTQIKQYTSQFLNNIETRLRQFELPRRIIWADYMTVEVDSEKGTISVGDEQISVLVCNFMTFQIHRRDGVEFPNPTYIPLYLYVSWNVAELILKNRKLKASEPRKCNDIYEFMPAWQNEEEKEQIFNNCSGMEQVMLCLSRVPDSTVMWGHYGDFGRGAVLQFVLPVYKLICGDNPDETLLVVAENEEDVKSGISMKKSILIAEVTYQKERPVYKPTSNYYQYTRFTSTKGEDWKYENEMRITFNYDEYGTVKDGDKFFTPAIMKYLRGMILGANCAYSVKGAKERMKQLARDSGKKYRIEVKKAAYSPTLYTLEVPAERCHPIDEIPLSRFERLCVTSE